MIFLCVVGGEGRNREGSLGIGFQTLIYRISKKLYRYVQDFLDTQYTGTQKLVKSACDLTINIMLFINYCLSRDKYLKLRTKGAIFVF